MTRFILGMLAILILLPTLAFAADNVAFLTKDSVQIGQKVQILASEFGDLNTCGQRYTTVYRVAITDEFGGSRKVVRLWGSNLKGLYTVEKLAKGDGASDCAVLARPIAK